MEIQLNLFGEEYTRKAKNPTGGSQNPIVFRDYESFVAKFTDAAKTTDDCYTPQDVYEAVVRYVGTITDMSDKQILRPFYPGGDYLNAEYPENGVVIDNPPFSMFTKIVRFYTTTHKTQTHNMKTETILGQVIGKANNYQAVPDGHGGRRIIKNGKLRAYERLFASQCRIYRGRWINRPFRLHLTVFEASRAFDLDNSIKTILDCLQYAHAIKDDNLCVGIVAEKKIDPRNPRIVYGIEELEPRLF